MARRVDALLNRIYEEGVENDQSTDDRSQKMFNITPDTGEFLHWLINELQPKRILELGTSNGYSTIWIGRAAEMAKASVVSVDFMPHKIASAARNINAAGLAQTISLQLQSIGKFLSTTSENAYDFVFLDSDRFSYCDWWPKIERSLQFGTLVVDNATSHPAELRPFLEMIDEEAFRIDQFHIGKGQMIIRPSDRPLTETVLNEIRQRETRELE